jgi:hypothetical protein
MGGGLFFQRRVGVLDDFIAGRFKRIGRYVGEFGGNKNLVHVGMVENVIVQWYGQKVPLRSLGSNHVDLGGDDFPGIRHAEEVVHGCSILPLP